MGLRPAGPVDYPVAHGLVVADRQEAVPSVVEVGVDDWGVQQSDADKVVVMRWLFEVGRVAWWVKCLTGFSYVKEMVVTPQWTDPYDLLGSYGSIVVRGSLSNNSDLFFVTRRFRLSEVE